MGKEIIKAVAIYFADVNYIIASLNRCDVMHNTRRYSLLHTLKDRSGWNHPKGCNKNPIRMASSSNFIRAFPGRQFDGQNRAGRGTRKSWLEELVNTQRSLQQHATPQEETEKEPRGKLYLNLLLNVVIR